MLGCHGMSVKFIWFSWAGICCCVPNNGLIIGFLNSTLKPLQFGYKFGMIQMTNGFKKTHLMFGLYAEKSPTGSAWIYPK
jgi:hypothetical protein